LGDREVIPRLRRIAGGERVASEKRWFRVDRAWACEALAGFGDSFACERVGHPDPDVVLGRPDNCAQVESDLVSGNRERTSAGLSVLLRQRARELSHDLEMALARRVPPRPGCLIPTSVRRQFVLASETPPLERSLAAAILLHENHPALVRSQPGAARTK